VLLDEASRPKSTCIRCNTCDGFPCLVHAKSDAETIAVRPILGLPNVTLLVDAEVERLETDPSGRSVTRVIVNRDETIEAYEGDIVVVSAGAANSARILLRSAGDAHPSGLANGSDQLGRNYMFHNSKAVVAIDKEPNDTVFQKTLGLNDFYFAGDGRQWPLGNMHYPNISDHGLIGDLQTAALVSTDGTVNWFCCPRFDSPSVFASLLDAGKGGYFRIAPEKRLRD
jgi:choline dehydrogenase-like flavoprotein